VATDLDPRQVAVARTRRPPGAAVRHAVMDASRMALGTARFDLVIAQYMLHHVPDWPGLLQETARVLRPGGHLLWLDFALPGWLVRSHHAGPFHGPSVTAACAAAGLTRVRYEGPALGVGTQRAVFRKGSP